MKKIKNRLLPYLLKRDDSPQQYIIGLHIIELFVTTFCFHQKLFQSLGIRVASLQEIVNLDPGSLSIIITVAIMILQLVFGISLVRAFYPPIIILGLSGTVAEAIISVVLVFISLTIDGVRLTQGSFYSSRIYASSECSSVYINLYSMAVLIIIHTLFHKQEVILNSILIGVSTILLFFRIRRKDHSIVLKIFGECLYVTLILGCFLERFGHMTGMYLSPLNHLMIECLGIIGYTLIRLYFTQKPWRGLTFREIIEENRVFQTCQIFLVELYEDQFCQDFSKTIEQILSQAKQVKMPPLTVETKQLYREVCYELLKSDENTPEMMLMKARCEYSIHKNYYLSWTILNKLHIRWSSPLFKLQTYRLRVNLLVDLKFKEERLSQMKKQLLRESKFLQLIGSATTLYVSLWEMLMDPASIPRNVNRLCLKIIKTKTQIHKKYRSFNPASKQISELFSIYLSLVERNLPQVKEVQDKVKALGHLPIHITYHNSFYVQISAEEETFGRFLSVSANVLGLLNIQCDKLKNESINSLIPDFFKRKHDGIIRKICNDPKSNTQLYAIKRRIFLEDGNGCIRKAFLKLNMFQHNDQMILRGHILLEENTNAFIVREQTGMLLTAIPLMNIAKFTHLMDLCKLTYGEMMKTLKQGKLQIIQDKFPVSAKITREIMLDELFLMLECEIIERSSYRHISSQNLTKMCPHNEFDFLPLGHTSSLWKFFNFKQQILKYYNFTKQIIQIVLVWHICLAFLFCSISSILLQLQSSSVKNGHINQMQSISQQQIAYIQAVRLCQQVDNTKHYSAKYNKGNLTEIVRKLGRNLNGFSINNLLTIKIAGQQFKTNNKFMMREAYSMLDYISKGDVTPGSIAHQQQDILINTWYNVTSVGFKQQTEELWVQYEGTRNKFRISYIALLVIKIVLAISFTIVIIILERERLIKQGELFENMLKIREKDIEILLKDCQSYRVMLEARELLDRNSVHTEHSRQRNKMVSSMLADITNSSMLSGTMNISQFPINMASTARGRLIENDEETTTVKKLQTKKQGINIFLLILILVTAGVVIVVSTISFDKTFDQTYILRGYLLNFLTMEDKIVSFGRVFLGWSLVLNNYHSPETSALFFTTVQQYQLMDLKSLDESIIQNEQFGEFNKFRRSINYQPMCQYINCTVYQSEMNLTLKDATLDRILRMQDDVRSNKTVSQILMSDTPYLISYSGRVMLEQQEILIKKYIESLKVHLGIVSYRQMVYYFVEVGAFLLLLAVIVVPFTIVTLLSRKNNMAVLDIFKERNYVLVEDKK